MRLKTIVYRSAVALAVSTLVVACTSTGRSRSAESRSQDAANTDRKIVRSGDITVSVDDPEEASREIERIVKDAGGFVERSNITKDSGGWLRCRVPATDLDRIMDEVAGLGDEEYRSVSAADVTEQYADLETRLRNDIALRDRLRKLLDRAADVEDVLAIERELNRIQSGIETMQARFDRLKSKIELSALSVKLERARILGPLGYIGYGLWWAFSKLFVIR